MNKTRRAPKVKHPRKRDKSDVLNPSNYHIPFVHVYHNNTQYIKPTKPSIERIVDNKNLRRAQLRPVHDWGVCYVRGNDGLWKAEGIELPYIIANFWKRSICCKSSLESKKERGMKKASTSFKAYTMTLDGSSNLLGSGNIKGDVPAVNTLVSPFKEDTSRTGFFPLERTIEPLVIMNNPGDT